MSTKAKLSTSQKRRRLERNRKIMQAALIFVAMMFVVTLAVGGFLFAIYSFADGSNTPPISGDYGVVTPDNPESTYGEDESAGEPNECGDECGTDYDCLQDCVECDNGCVDDYCYDDEDNKDEPTDDERVQDETRPLIAIPRLIADSFAFDGTIRSVALDITGPFVLSGTTSAIDVGTHTATITLTTNGSYAWADGTTGVRVLTWTIMPVQLSVTTPSDISLVYGEYDNLYDIKIDGWRWISEDRVLKANGEGELFVLRYIASEDINFVTIERTIRVTVIGADKIIP